MMAVAVALLAVAPCVLLALLTGLGQRRRGTSGPLVALAGLAFPVTWLIWYLRDERPFRRPA
ncbi:hypothetical protein E8D34_15000 [Nocardioides sp. GY 10113]|uniref:hypothetical protein n=1 Tax=Nocardioides sp. GY 10113 TaxID=2569761 RepID=UPI0010A7DC3B|nr:hypothetical protein [Nocardioides sp. GY 10113]TIC83868.1 hypothetical protein E8D34_15000 [Nocardioides sp. GY 10113]